MVTDFSLTNLHSLQDLEKVIMSGDDWNAQKMLDLYIHDYLKKKNLHNVAQTFKTEANVAQKYVDIDVPGGFIAEWWSIFYDMFASRERENIEAMQEAVIQERDEQSEAIMQPEQLHSRIQQYDMSQQMVGQMVPTMYEKRLKYPSSAGLYPNLGMSVPVEPTLTDVPNAILPRCRPRFNIGAGPLLLGDWPSTGIEQRPPGWGQPVLAHTPERLIPYISHNVAHPDPQMCINLRGELNGRDGKLSGINDTRQTVSSIQTVSRMGRNAPNDEMMIQRRKTAAHQRLLYQIKQQQLQEFLKQTCRARKNPSYFRAENICPVRRSITPADEWKMLDLQLQHHKLQENERRRNVLYYGVQNFPVQGGIIPLEEWHSLDQQLEQQQLQENDRKRKSPSFSGAPNIFLQGNTGTLVKSVMSTPTHVPHDIISKPATVLTQSYGEPEVQKMQGSGGIGELASTIEKMNDGSSNDVESSSSHVKYSDDSKDPPFSTSLQSSTAGFSFEEVGCIHLSKSKVVCCDFSSDGKLLASAGDNKKVTLLDTNSFDFKSTSEGHSRLITDVRFRPSSTLLATSSVDKTIQVWDATNPNLPLYELVGHTKQVMSLDFHPKQVDLLTSCDGNGEIRFWNVNKRECTCITKLTSPLQNGTTQVRFQPQDGQLLAVASKKSISIIDVESKDHQFFLQGHVQEVRSVCWDTSGKYIASASEDRVLVFDCTGSKECIHELRSNGNKFQSITFHPGYSLLLVIGGDQSLELWSPTESRRTMKVPAHYGLIAALANSPTTRMVASSSYDRCVKLWK